MVMGVYVKNPEYVEAVQWTGDNIHKMMRFCDQVRVFDNGHGVMGTHLAFIADPEKIIPRGSYLIRDRDGEYRAVDFNYFKNNYRKV